jgi:hypothetical protein
MIKEILLIICTFSLGAQCAAQISASDTRLEQRNWGLKVVIVMNDDGMHNLLSRKFKSSADDEDDGS